MSNALTIQSFETFSISRTSKSGKETKRNLLGLMIEGTANERLESGIVLAKEGWENGKMLIVLETLQRVFSGTMFTAATVFCKLDVAKPTKPEMANLMENLARIYADSKGIKAKYVKLCNELVEWHKAEADRKAARKAAFDAEQAALNAPNTVEATAQ